MHRHKHIYMHLVCIFISRFFVIRPGIIPFIYPHCTLIVMGKTLGTIRMGSAMKRLATIGNMMDTKKSTDL